MKKESLRRRTKIHVGSHYEYEIVRDEVTDTPLAALYHENSLVGYFHKFSEMYKYINGLR